MATLKVKFEDFIEFLDDFEAGMFGRERLGQAFLNKFLPRWEVPMQFDYEVYSCLDYLTVKAAIINKYVDM